MTQVISINTKTADAILSALKRLEEAISRLNEKLEQTPPYGSKAWWKQSDKKALESIRRGEGTTVHGQKELQTFLNSLKTA